MNMGKLEYIYIYIYVYFKGLHGEASVGQAALLMAQAPEEQGP